MTETNVPEALVARLVTDDELIINRGSKDGVKQGMRFKIVDSLTEDVFDPVSGENLGSIERIKTQIEIISVSDKISLARVYPSRGRANFPSNIDMLMGPKPPSPKLTGDRWPDGTAVNDKALYISG